MVMSSENHSKRPAKGAASVPWGQSTCQAKKSARLRITPTTAAVMPVERRGELQVVPGRLDRSGHPPG